MARQILRSIESEYRRYKKLAEDSLEQLRDDELSVAPGSGDNSITALVWHISGNLASRFTDFLASDGEKPWRNREEEFAARRVSRRELSERWERGWAVLFRCLAELDDGTLHATVTVRREPLAVHDALHRSLAHTSYHVGQIVFLAKALRGGSWRYLSIPPGGSPEAK